MEKILVTKEKEDLYNIIEHITKTREKIVLQNGDEEFVIVTKKEAGLLEVLMEMFSELVEDKIDLLDAEEARRQIDEEGSLSLDEVKKILGRE